MTSEDSYKLLVSMELIFYQENENYKEFKRTLVLYPFLPSIELLSVLTDYIHGLGDGFTPLNFYVHNREGSSLVFRPFFLFKLLSLHPL